MSGNPNSLNNNQMLHKGFGMSSLGMQGNGKQCFGLLSESPYLGENLQLPAYFILRSIMDVSPFAFRVIETPVLGGLLAGKSLRYPNVMYDSECFGTKREAKPSRVFKPWRMYVIDSSTNKTYMVESNDGVEWGAPELIAVTEEYNYGFKPFYDEDGLVTYDNGVDGPVVYKFAAIARDGSKTTGDSTDLNLCLSNDGITWVEVAMADHDVSGNPFGNEVASSLGTGAVYMAKQDSSLTFSATLPKTFFGADGWHAFVGYQDAPAQAGDTVFGCTIMGQNSSDDQDAAEIGHFANWNRNLLRQVGERSFGQCVKMVPKHVVKYSDMYIALVQLYYSVGTSATLVPSGMALAVSKDGLIFESCGPLYDAGLTHALNDRSSAVDQDDMKPTSYLANTGVGDGSQIIAGSIVVDKDGLAFGGNAGGNNRAFIRVYWTEEDSGRILIGEL